jgi:hypothetical protein
VRLPRSSCCSCLCLLGKVKLNQETIQSHVKNEVNLLYKYPPSIVCNGYGGALSPGVIRQGLEAGHSPPTSAEAKETWLYTSTHPYLLLT